jgi:diacylglycerol kinase family enzyme
MVRRRDAERHRRGLPKWLATVPAASAALGRLRHHRMTLSTGGASRRVRTPLLFVGNNRYLLERGRIGERVALDDGLLSIFSVAESSRAGLVWFAARALAGFVDPERDFAAFDECAELTVTARSARIDVALDGEVRRLKTPLRFRVDPGALSVRVPAAVPVTPGGAA